MEKKQKQSGKKQLGIAPITPKNKKGQMGMGLMAGMFTAVFVFIMLSAFLPVIIEMLGTTKGSNSANCVNYVDPNGIYSYNSSLSTDTITCSIINFTPGMFVLAIIFAIISGIISGKLAMSSQQEPQYPQY